MNNNLRLAVICLVVSLLVAPGVLARTLRYSAQADAGTLDPHSLNHLVVSRILVNVYEGLVGRDKDFRIAPELATEWKQIDPLTWRFRLRPGVRFHDGTPFTADDVVFSVERALHQNSYLKASVQGVKAARKVDNLTVELLMAEPNPVLLNHLANLRIMSKAWSVANNCIHPQRFNEREETFASRNTNGTGPYKVTLRQTDVKTVMVENKDWWNRQSPDRGNITEVVWQPISASATRMAALLSGEIDFVIDLPLQDVEKVAAVPSVKLVQGKEPRIIFLAFDMARDELLYGSVKGRNPLKDLRVRQAFVHAIDIDLITAKVLRNLAVPASSIVAPGVQGYSGSLGPRLPHDPAKARALLAAAGYPSGFELSMDCQNTAPLLDVCKAIATMLARADVKVSLNAIPSAAFAAKVQKADTSFFAWGWGSTTVDSLYVLQSLLYTHSSGPSGNGDYNMGRYSNATLDGLIDRIRVEPDMKTRDGYIQDALRVVSQDLPLVPIYQQVYTWAVRKNVKATFSPNNLPYFYRYRID